MTSNKTTALIEHIAKALFAHDLCKRDVYGPQVYENRAKVVLEALAAFEQPQQSDKDASLSKSADSESQVREMMEELSKALECIANPNDSTYGNPQFIAQQALNKYRKRKI